MSAFGKSFRALHRTARRLFGSETTGAGRDEALWLWWVEDVAQAEMRVASVYSHPLRAYSGEMDYRRAQAAGLVVIPTGSRQFAASLADFPAGTRPRLGMCFWAGVSEADRRFYRVGERIQCVAGVVEFEAVEEY